MHLPTWTIPLIQFLSFSFIWKGLGLLVLGLIGLAYAYSVRDRRVLEKGWYVFFGVSAGICLLGIFILLFRPVWWGS